MIFKKDLPEIPSIAEAAFIASILDEAGLFEDAGLMDEFIKGASRYNGNFVKQAGLWSAIWNRLGGLTKRLFFKEYRQLYTKAKDAQKNIQERFEKAEKAFKQAKKQINNYDLVGWRETVLALPIYTKDLMADYEMAFGKLIAFTFDLQKKENIPSGEFDISKITPPGEGGEGGSEGEPEDKKTTQKRNLNIDTRFFKEKGWQWADPLTKSIAKNSLKDEIAIDRDKFNRMKRTHIIDASSDPNKDYVRLAKHDRGFPKGLKEALGNSVWQIVEHDSDWVYLAKVAEEVKEVTPQEEVGEEMPEGFEPPSLPQIDLPLDKSEEKKLKAIEDISKKDVESVSGQPIISSDKDKELYNKMMSGIGNKVWISYRHGAGKDRFRLVDPGDIKPGQTAVTDQSLVSKLNDTLFLQNYKGKRRKKIFYGSEVEADDNEISKAELVNTILFKK